MFLGEEKVRGQRDTVGRRVKLEAQIGVMLLPAKKCQGAGREAWSGFPPRAFGGVGHGPADALTLDFQPPGL